MTNCLRKAFEQRIEETDIKIQPWVNANWPLNN